MGKVWPALHVIEKRLRGGVTYNSTEITRIQHESKSEMTDEFRDVR